jgi:signal transduction histidine kinase/CheY-like chemotaxis protein/DNA-binding LacI/PurR family transcriptional regulator
MLEKLMTAPRAPRIALLTDALLTRSQLRLVTGATHAAERAGASLLCFNGGTFSGDAGRAAGRDGSFLYDLARSPCIDGLVVVSDALVHEQDYGALQNFASSRGVPVVSIGELEDIPSVLLDDSTGLERIVGHLIDDHARTCFGFVRATRDALRPSPRESAFRAALASCGLRPDPRLVIDGGATESAGQAAARALTAETGLLQPLTTLVVEHERAALGVLRELAAQQRRLPAELAVVSFEDVDGPRVGHRCLTTVARPVEQLGQRAVELVCQLLRGEPVPAKTRVETYAVYRRSCVCVTSPRGEPDTQEADPFSDLEAPLTAFAKASGLDAEPDAAELEAEEPKAEPEGSSRALAPRAPARSLAALGVRVLIEELQYTASGGESTLSRFDRVLALTRTAGADPAAWHDVVWELGRLLETRQRFAVPITLKEFLARAASTVDASLTQGRAEDVRLALERSALLRSLGNNLVKARDYRSLEMMMRAALPALEVTRACVCLFDTASPGNARVLAVLSAENSAYPPVEEEFWASLAALERPTSEAPPGIGEVLVSQRLDELIPSSLAEPGQSLRVAVYPLTFAHRALGYVILEQPRHTGAGFVNESLVMHLGSAVHLLEHARSLSAAREMAERANAAKTDFVASLSHEIRTPVTAILGYLDLCARTQLSPQQSHYIDLARSASRTLLAIVNDTLDFSKIEAQKLELENTVFVLDDVLDQLVGTFGAVAAQKGVELVVDVEPDVPIAAVGDPLRLGQVLHNLVGNAVKFTEAGEVVLSIGCVEASADALSLRFSVRDTGVGIPEEAASRLMRPFTQGESSTSRRYGGTGLGLVISQRLVGMMGGRLTVVSSVGQGSTFSFDARLRPAKGHEERRITIRGLRVVALEPNASQRRALAGLLESRGAEADVLPNEAAVLAALGCHRYDAAIIGLGQAATAPTELLAKLRDHVESIVVLAPPSALERLGADGLDQGFAVIPRPSQRGALLECLREGPRGPRSNSSRPPGLEIDPQLSARLKGKRVLLVEDNRVKRDVARELLELVGLEVEAARTGLEAVQRAAHSKYDVILMDLHMPEMDGFKAARAIRSGPLGDSVPIIALSASALAEHRQRSLAAGMNDYIATPCEPSRLYMTLASWLLPRNDGTRAPAPSANRPSSPPVPSSPNRSAPVLAAAAGLRRAGQKPKLYSHLLRSILEEHADTADQIRRAIAAGDTATARELVHGFSGAAGMVGADELHSITGRLERALEEGNSPACFRYLSELSAAAPRALRAMREWLAQNPQ